MRFPHLRPRFLVLAITPAVLVAIGAACGSSGSSSGGGGGSGGGVASSGSGGSAGCAAYPGAGFCDDFENETDAAFFTNWPSAPYRTNPQFLLPVVQTSPSAYSPSHVLHAEADFAPDSGSAGQRFTLIGRGLPTVLASQTLSVGFSMRMLSFVAAEGGYETGPSPDVQISFNAIEGAGPSCLVELQGKDPTHYWATVCGVLVDAGFPTTSVAFTLGTWQRLTVAASFASDGGSTGLVTLSVDGTVVASEPMGGGGTASTQYSGSLSIGSFAYDETPSMVMDIDDVVIEQH
jgi:hypothetical protein